MVKPLLDRLRYDGSSWAQPLFNEAADRIAEMERHLSIRDEALVKIILSVGGPREWGAKDTLPAEAVDLAEEAARQLAEARSHAAGLDAALAQIMQSRCEQERQLAEARGALRDLVDTLDCRVDIQPLLGFREHAQIRRARAAVQDRAPSDRDGG